MHGMPCESPHAPQQSDVCEQLEESAAQRSLPPQLAMISVVHSIIAAMTAVRLIVALEFFFEAIKRTAELLAWPFSDSSRGLGVFALRSTAESAIHPSLILIKEP
jgi:hypothetical protein